MTALVKTPPDQPLLTSLPAPAPGDERADIERTAPAAPDLPMLELERLRREVKSRLFGTEQGQVSIDRYRILSCVGQGGMGIVYAARDERLGRTVALKLLRPDLNRLGSDGHADLAKEAQSLAKLSHPNVVAVFDVGEHDGQLFVAMEYVEGQSLRRWLETPRSLAAILEVYIAAGEGLAAAHKAALIHRDFKPDNVLVGADGRPRILDFGLARGPEPQVAARPPAFADSAEATATSLSRHGVLLGTPAYMAPEQHLGERADARSDQFGFCVALYQALYRALPFPTDDLRALSLAIVAGKLTPPPVVPGVPDRLRRLVLRGLRVEPDARYPNMETLLAELRDVRIGLDTLAEPAAPPASPGPSYDTRAIERAFGVGPRADAGGGRRPSLSEAEVAEIADEVGLELHASSPDLGVDATAGEPNHFKAGERTHFGMPSTILAERELSALPSFDTQRRVVRELERNLGGTGGVEQFEGGMTWANREAEVSIDRQPGGARLVIRRSFATLARKRRRRGIVLGGFLGFFTGAVLTDLLPGLLVAFEPVLVFSGLGLGILAGLEVTKKIHERQMSEERELLGWVSERIAALVTAERDQQALPSKTSGR
ncbi:Serine/threonine-protein kinase PknB [Enhygromyxa salina]|uniref:Serine/threonine-protein kinase PknB n=1 Tax=Enhygromyxa salina TaxID=215803 RepID=A0A2S9YUU4_9BACT|nr:Serine/threonine-protein kinase PknB [Enhygromyxa salina]